MNHYMIERHETRTIYCVNCGLETDQSNFADVFDGDFGDCETPVDDPPENDKKVKE